MPISRDSRVSNILRSDSSVPRLLLAFSLLATAAAQAADLSYTLQLDTVQKFWDGRYDWAQVCVGAIPGAGKDGGVGALITTQKEDNTSSDYYAGVHSLWSGDLGATWTVPTPHPELTPHKNPDGTIRGLCDFVSGWHAPTKRFLITGHTVLYANGRLAPTPYSRTTAYAVFDPATKSWSQWAELAMPDAAKFYNAGSGCGQWVIQPDGTILLPVYYKPESEDKKECYTATIVHCSFDGKQLKYLAHGDELRHEVPRGYCEPSLTFFQGKYYLTLRNDVRGYVSTSTDGLHFGPIVPWEFDDGVELGSYNTQQHWATHSDGLFLVYTRRGANNDHVIRNRAPLFMAQVDPEKLQVVRATEQAVVPDRGASLGNFAVANISENETWVTVGECMYSPECEKRGADGSIFAARIKWNSPNKAMAAGQPIPR